MLSDTELNQSTRGHGKLANSVDSFLRNNVLFRIFSGRRFFMPPVWKVRQGQFGSVVCPSVSLSVSCNSKCCIDGNKVTKILYARINVGFGVFPRNFLTDGLSFHHTVLHTYTCTPGVCQENVWYRDVFARFELNCRQGICISQTYLVCFLNLICHRDNHRIRFEVTALTFDHSPQ